MLEQIWTAFLVGLLGVSLGAWGVLVCRAKGIHPIRDVVGFFRRQTKMGKVLLGLFLLVMWVFASTKPEGESAAEDGDEGTNGVNQVAAEVMGALMTSEYSGDRLEVLTGVASVSFAEELQQETDAEITSTNTTETLDAEDFERKFVLARIGTNEAMCFAPPTNAIICSDWKTFGAATDWIYLTIEDDWAFTLGTNTINRFRVSSFGKVEPFVRDEASTWFAPMEAELGIVPECNWPHLQESPSQFWYSISPSNTLQLTWQNVLLGREVTNPVSFQVELWTQGKFVYHYDLSHLGDEIISNVCVGASLLGTTWSTNNLAANTTSMKFYIPPEDTKLNLDPDNDGITTSEEMYLYDTDPYNKDTDYDGLTDYEELFIYNTNPLNPYSINPNYSDAFALKLGDVDPFSCPAGSTNTIYEHLFYSGTTNGVFAYPESSADAAVLRVDISGSGVGDLIIDGQVVPLIAPQAQPMLLSAANAETESETDSSSLWIRVTKGGTKEIILRTDETLQVRFYSDDFAFGKLPSVAKRMGEINFPTTTTETPCIHDFDARGTMLHLPMSTDAEDLTCTWTGKEVVSLANQGLREARITKCKSLRKMEGNVTYTVDHPLYLFGEKTYTQSFRFCPPLSELPAEEEVWEKHINEEHDEEQSKQWCCYLGTCCSKGNSCTCSYQDCKCGESGTYIEEEDYSDEICNIHHTDYNVCEPLHYADYTNAVRMANLTDVLYIRDPLEYGEMIHLDVSSSKTNCCPCPSHGATYLTATYISEKLRLVDLNEEVFVQTNKSCDVKVAGCFPSEAVGDAQIVFTQNGEIYKTFNATVLGVAIKGHTYDLKEYNKLSPYLGYPITVSTNFHTAADLCLRTDVKLSQGNIHLELQNVTGQFAIWYYDCKTQGMRKLLDSTTIPTKDLSLNTWRTLMKRAGVTDSPDLPICITSSSPGKVQLLFRYWAIIDGQFIEDTATQTITSILPPLRVDINRDGSIDENDSDVWLNDRRFYYWINNDTTRGNYIGENSNSNLNSSDLCVNGAFDLVNFFPIAIDLKPFVSTWGPSATYLIHPLSFYTGDILNYCFANVPWHQAGSIQTTNTVTTRGQELSQAQLTALSEDEYFQISFSTLINFSKDSGLMLCEARQKCYGLQLDINVGGKTLYSYTLPMSTRHIKDMYNWLNVRGLSGAEVNRRTETNSLYGEDNSKSLIFLHGANVDEAAAETWGDIIFKRLWLSGMHANFYNVAWRGDIGAAENYQENASNAFVVAQQLAPILSNISGEKVIMAHSLGNMVASSMIQDYGLQVSKFIMCNSAVPSEAYYDPDDISIRVAQLVHPEWENYPTNSWASNWHKLFGDDENDDRRLLGWPGRFKDVNQYAVNFYSTGDEVLELNDDNDIEIWTGITSSYRQYAWHHQELWKGRTYGNYLGGTTWSGWNIDESFVVLDKISVSTAQQMTDEDFKTNTVFYCYPSSMNSTNISLLVRAAHLTMGIPALAKATGVSSLSPVVLPNNNFDLNQTEKQSLDNNVSELINRPNEWPTRAKWKSRWLHSDIKDVAYFYIFNLFNQIITKGNLK